MEIHLTSLPIMSGFLDTNPLLLSTELYFGHFENKRHFVLDFLTTRDRSKEIRECMRQFSLLAFPY